MLVGLARLSVEGATSMVRGRDTGLMRGATASRACPCRCSIQDSYTTMTQEGRQMHPCRFDEDHKGKVDMCTIQIGMGTSRPHISDSDHWRHRCSENY